MKMGGKRITTENLKERFIVVHGDTFDLSRVIYVNGNTKIEIGCPIHGFIFCLYDQFLDSKTGCPKCGIKIAGESRRSSTEEFKIKAKDIHGDKYNYDKVEYVSAHEKVIIKCNECNHIINQTPHNHLVYGCNYCSHDKLTKQLTKPIEQFIIDSKLIHGSKYGYEKVHYINTYTSVIITCYDHGDFLQRPHCHINLKHGCPKCSFEHRKSSTEEFKIKAKDIHGDKYNYDEVEYIIAIVKIKIICKTHGEFEQFPYNHLRGSGCPQCSCRNYSELAIRWLEHIAWTEGINIQHAETTTGEFIIPNTKYSADGYCVETNTVYEFYGDAYHGNPFKYASDYPCHPFSELPALYWYEKTMKREQELISMGYNVITIWESDFKELQTKL